jgi:hypothetical protein
VCPGRSSGYLAEYLVLQVWVSPYRFWQLRETAEINHTKPSKIAPAKKRPPLDVLKRGSVSFQNYKYKLHSITESS